MPTVYLPNANIALNLPLTLKAGDMLDETQADILHGIWLKRLMQRMRWHFSRGEVDATSAQAKLDALATLPLEPYSSADFDDADDPILAEALDMARDLIKQRMAAEGLPEPKGLDLHARALVDQLPIILERARLRLEARYQAAAAAITGV